MNIAAVLKYEGDHRTFLWRHPETDFASGSQLIVHEAQEALVLQNGRILGKFGPGRHQLTTQNLPGIAGVVKSLFGGTSPFHCEVYFVSLAENMGIRWGTAGRVTYLDPVTGIPLSIGANGAISLRVRDAEQLLRRLVGTEAAFGGRTAMDAFDFLLQSKVKSYLGSYMHEGGVSIFEVDAHLNELSEALYQRLAPDFKGYGLELTQLRVMGTAKPDGDPSFERLRKTYADQFLRPKNAQIDQTVALIEADTAAEVRRRQGYTWQEEQSFAVAKDLAKNEGVGGFANAGIGLGMIGGVGTMIGSAMTQMTGRAMAPAAQGQAAGTPSDAQFCVHCGHPIDPSFAFCPHCGAKREV